MSRTNADFHSVARQAEGVLAVRDSKPMDDEVAISVASTKTLTVVDARTYATAGEHLTGFAALKKRIQEYWEDDVKNAHRLWTSLTSKRKKALDAVDAEIERLKRAMATWQTEQDRLQREAEQRAALEARRQEEARLTAEAALLEQQGQPLLAAAVLEQAIAAPAPVVVLPSSVPKVAGVSTVEAYSFRIINEALLPRQYLQPNEKAIREAVSRLKGACRIPGVEVFRDDQVRVRSAS